MSEQSICDSGAGGISHLARRIRAGDEEAFREFHARYFDRLYQFLLVVSRGNEQDAQEAVQETLLRVVRYARPFETEEAFWCWLKTVARSAARDRGRKQRRYLGLLQSFALRWKQAREQPDCEENYLSALLQESLAELEPADRQLVEGKYYSEETVKELSAQTGLTDKAVESRLLRLRRRLRERMLRKMNSV